MIVSTKDSGTKGVSGKLSFTSGTSSSGSSGSMECTSATNGKGGVCIMWVSLFHPIVVVIFV